MYVDYAIGKTYYPECGRSREYAPTSVNDRSGFFGYNILNNSSELIACVNRLNFRHVIERTTKAVHQGTYAQRKKDNNDFNGIDVCITTYQRHHPLHQTNQFPSVYDSCNKYQTEYHKEISEYQYINRAKNKELFSNISQLVLQVSLDDILNAPDELLYVEELDLLFYIFRYREEYFPLHPYSKDAKRVYAITKEHDQLIKETDKLHITIEAVSNSNHNEYNEERYINLDNNIHPIPVVSNPLLTDGVYVTVNQKLSTPSTKSEGDYTEIELKHSNEKITKRRYSFESACKNLHIKASVEDAVGDPFLGNVAAKLKHELDVRKLEQEEKTYRAKLALEQEKARIEKESLDRKSKHEQELLRQKMHYEQQKFIVDQDTIERKRAYDLHLDRLKRQQDYERLVHEQEVARIKQRQCQEESDAKRPKHWLEWLKAIAGFLSVGLSIHSLLK